MSIDSRIKSAAKKAGRPETEIRLVAVSKNQPNDKVIQYCHYRQKNAQVPLLGESYVQEFRSKAAALPNPVSVHLIGPLQSNKAAMAVKFFDLIHSVHSEKIALSVDKEARKINKIQSVLLQVNTSGDAAKSGFGLSEFDSSLMRRLASLPNLRIEGLMTITQLYDLPEQARTDFRLLRELGDRLKSSLCLPSCVLSMGMSDDFEVAIEEGATYVRIGSALFGERPKD